MRMVRRRGFFSGWKKGEDDESIRWRVLMVRPRKKGDEERRVIMYVLRMEDRGRMTRDAL